MVTPRIQPSLFFLIAMLFVALSPSIAGCSATPTPRPTPTFTLNASPTTQVQAGKSVAIVAKVEPLEKLNLKWSISGTSGGTLSTKEGENVIYTAGTKEGIDIIVADGTTASGVPVKQTVSLTVLPPPSPTATSVPPTATPTSTATPVPPTTAPPLSPIAIATATPPCQSWRPPIGGPAVTGEAKITSQKNCATGLSTATNAQPLAGTYRGIPDNLDLWILSYPPDMKYYPQSPNACMQLPVSRSSERWNVNMYLGRPGIPEQFDLVAVLADAQASQAFKDYLKKGCDTGSYVGFSVLPPGQITEMDAITVFTK